MRCGAARDVVCSCARTGQELDASRGSSTSKRLEELVGGWTMEDVRSRLLDLTRSNRLLNHKAEGARNIRIVDEIPAEVYRLLVEEKRTMQFLSWEEAPKELRSAFRVIPASEEGGEGEGRHWTLPLDAEIDPSRHTDRKLQTVLAGEKLQTRLLAMARDAKVAIEEQGCNMLYLTLGMVEWRAAGEVETVNRAPLLFLPAQLERKNANSRHFVSLFEDEILTNPCLEELARRDFEFELPAFGEESEENAAEYLARAAEAVRKLRGWAFHDEIHLGLFSFAKMMMWRDLDDRHWPEGKKIVDHVLVRTLRGKGVEIAAEEQEVLGEEELDERRKPADCFHIMDADSSQHAAIEAVKSGANMVIEGPPGTGKSQTIANIIAESMAAGKTVLFVAEKAAALDVVKQRLERAGLGDVALALHSRNTNKVAVMEEIRRVLETAPFRTGPGQAGADALLSVRERLRAYHREIHQAAGAIKMSAFQAVGEATRWGEEPEAPCAVAGVLQWGREKLDLGRAHMEMLSRRLEAVGSRGAHPWRAAALESVPLHVRQSLPERGAEMVRQVAAIGAMSATMANELGRTPPATLAETAALLKAAETLLAAPVIDAECVQALNEGVKEQLVAWVGLFERHAREKAAWAAVLRDEAEEAAWPGWLERRQKSLGILRFLTRQGRQDRLLFRHMMRGPSHLSREDEIRTVQGVMTSAATRAEIVEVGGAAAPYLGGAWKGWPGDRQGVFGAARGILEAWALIAKKAVGVEVAARIIAGDRAPLREMAVALKTALDGLRQAYGAFLELCQASDEKWFPRGSQNERWEAIVGSVNRAIGAMDELDKWADLNAAIRAAREGPAAAFVEWALGERGVPRRLGGAFLRQFYRTWMEAALGELPNVKAWRGDDYAALAARFKELDREWIQTTRRRVRELVEAKRPDITGRTARETELGLIKSELRKKKRFMPLRKLLAQAGATIQCIKPCFMMSPISVAQYLTPGVMEFDVIIFDEASQVEPADAFGAIARGRQLVLVGDEKQLPPTSFFQRDGNAMTDEEEASLGDVESILGLGAARLGQSRQLRWHYRSRHASLISFSNDKFYQGQLRVFPSPHTDCAEAGLQFRFVADGMYMRGAGRYNGVEAKAVAQAVMEHARRFPGLSLGVGTLNRPQADAINDELEMLRRDPANQKEEAFFDDKREERFFIKNLENIQGDEREVMFLSVGYGYDAAHKITANFGALNGEGGWRRLNVFATRAKQRCVIFSSIRSEDIKLEKNPPRGVKALKEYLHMAEHGRLVEAAVSLRDPDSPFEADVCQALRGRGWEVHTQVGCAGFAIDLAVVDPRRPGRYLLGVECDGETYHRTPTARDRDRIRQEVLEGLGWTIHRIWSSDWFRMRSATLDKLAARIEALAAKSGTSTSSAATTSG
jgi:very-short-patch-repair endonuclease